MSLELEQLKEQAALIVDTAASLAYAVQQAEKRLQQSIDRIDVCLYRDIAEIRERRSQGGRSS